MQKPVVTLCLSIAQGGKLVNLFGFCGFSRLFGVGRVVFCRTSERDHAVDEDPAMKKPPAGSAEGSGVNPAYQFFGRRNHHHLSVLELNRNCQ